MIKDEIVSTLKLIGGGNKSFIFHPLSLIFYLLPQYGENSTISAANAEFAVLEVFLCGRVLLCVYFLYSVHNGHTLIDEVDGKVVGVERIHLHTNTIGGMLNADIAAEEEIERLNKITIVVQIAKIRGIGLVVHYAG